MLRTKLGYYLIWIQRSRCANYGGTSSLLAQIYSVRSRSSPTLTAAQETAIIGCRGSVSEGNLQCVGSYALRQRWVRFFFSGSCCGHCITTLLLPYCSLDTTAPENSDNLVIDGTTRKRGKEINMKISLSQRGIVSRWQTKSSASSHDLPFAAMAVKMDDDDRSPLCSPNSHVPRKAVAIGSIPPLHPGDAPPRTTHHDVHLITSRSFMHEISILRPIFLSVWFTLAPAQLGLPRRGPRGPPATTCQCQRIRLRLPCTVWRGVGVPFATEQLLQNTSTSRR